MSMENLGGTPAQQTGTGATETATPSQTGQAPPINNPFADLTLAELGLEEEAGGSQEEGGTPPPEGGKSQVLSKSKATETGPPEDADESDEEDDEPGEPKGEPDGEGEGEEPKSKAEFEHPKFLKRVNRLTAEKKALAEEKEKLEARVKELEASREQSAPVEDPGDPVWRRPEAVEANKALQTAKTETDAAQALLDRIEDDDLDGVVEVLKGHKVTLPSWDKRTVTRALQRYHAEQAQELATRTAELRSIRTSHRREHDANRKAYDAAANEHFSWLSDKSDPRTEKVEKLLKVNPLLGREAIGRFAAAALVKELGRYQKARAQVNKPLSGAPQKRETTLPNAGNGAPAPKPQTASSARIAAAEQRFQQDPTSEDGLTEFIAATTPGLG